MRDKAKKAKYDKSYQKEYRASHSESDRREYMQKYYANNREAIDAYRKEYNARNAEIIGARRRKHVYGITPEQYDEKLSNQEGLCAICRGQPDVFSVDHCHETGMVRGLLCGACNRMLGSAKDSSATLQNAIAYLDYHHEGEE